MHTDVLRDQATSSAMEMVVTVFGRMEYTVSYKACYVTLRRRTGAMAG